MFVNNNNNNYFNCQVYLASICSNWGHCKLKLLQIKFNQTQVFEERGKTSQNREENQQTQPTHNAESGNRTRATLVEGECSHHCSPYFILFYLGPSPYFPLTFKLNQMQVLPLTPFHQCSCCFRLLMILHSH